MPGEQGSLSPADIGPDYRPALTTQHYGPTAVIDGVQRIDLRLMIDDSGSFAEVVRLDSAGRLEALPGFQVRQTSYSLVLPGAIKAFHLHFNQDDVWFVPPTDRLLVGLIDTRASSPTYRLTGRYVLGGGKAQLLFIPRGVAHGASNTTDAPAHIFYFVNQQFSLTDPDERRLPWDIAGAEFWQQTPG
jgi:dTDP-4-dehydrorhamnose 3,5-epimerase